jgi:hypothetical protein
MESPAAVPVPVPVPVPAVESRIDIKASLVEEIISHNLMLTRTVLGLVQQQQQQRPSWRALGPVREVKEDAEEDDAEEDVEDEDEDEDEGDEDEEEEQQQLQPPATCRRGVCCFLGASQRQAQAQRRRQQLQHEHEHDEHDEQDDGLSSATGTSFLDVLLHVVIVGAMFVLVLSTLSAIFGSSSLPVHFRTAAAFPF